MLYNKIYTYKLAYKKLRSIIAISSLAVVLNQTLNPGVIDPHAFGPVAVQKSSRTQIPSKDVKLLWALNKQEASGKAVIRSRYEPGFYKRYIKGRKKYRHLEARFGGRAVASSYGPWQIMYPTAYDLGYRGKPEYLSDATTSLPYVLKYVDYRRKKLKGDERAIISAYNAGLGGVGTNPRYTSKVIAYLRTAPENWTVYGTT